MNIPESSIFSILGLILCGFLFIITMGIGYLIIGGILANHEWKNKCRGDALGILLIWPMWLLMIWFGEFD